MSIFDWIENILFNKKDINCTIEDFQNYSPFIINRYISQYDNNINFFLNSTVNINSEIFQDKETHFKFLRSCLPKCKKKFIRYIKKNNNSKNDNSLSVKLYELSSREIDIYKNLFDINTVENKIKFNK